MPTKKPTKQQIAEQALASSGLNLQMLTPAQRTKIVNKLKRQIPAPSGGRLQPRSGFFACLACRVGLTVLVGVPLAALILAGTTVGPELTIVVFVAQLFSLTAEAATVGLSAALAVGGAKTVGTVVNGLCERFGACEPSDGTALAR